MKITTITVGADMKLSRKFQSAGGQVSITASLGDDDHLEDVARKLKAYVRDEVKDMAIAGMEDVETITS